MSVLEFPIKVFARCDRVEGEIVFVTEGRTRLYVYQFFPGGFFAFFQVDAVNPGYLDILEAPSTDRDRAMVQVAFDDLETRVRGITLLSA